MRMANFSRFLQNLVKMESSRCCHFLQVSDKDHGKLPCCMRESCKISCSRQNIGKYFFDWFMKILESVKPRKSVEVLPAMSTRLVILWWFMIPSQTSDSIWYPTWANQDHVQKFRSLVCGILWPYNDQRQWTSICHTISYSKINFIFLCHAS